jgi:DnaJ-class molecular chaperone
MYEEKSVDIPAGIEREQAILLEGYGAAAKGGRNGNLYINVNYKKSSFFSREGNNLIVNVLVDPFVAIVGGKVKVPTIDGVRQITIPKGTLNGDRITISGQGFVTKKLLKNRTDLIAVIKIVKPTAITREQ